MLLLRALLLIRHAGVADLELNTTRSGLQHACQLMADTRMLLTHKDAAALLEQAVADIEAHLPTSVRAELLKVFCKPTVAMCLLDHSLCFLPGVCASVYVVRPSVCVCVCVCS